MVNTLLKFVSCARTAGLRVSTSEVLDCLRQLELVDILDEPQFAAVLRANFAKSRREQHHFNRLYQLFFHELRQNTTTAYSESMAEQIQDILQALNTEGTGNETFQTMLDFLGGDPLPYFEQLRQIGSNGDDQNHGPGSNLGGVTQRLEIMLGLNSVEDALEQLLGEYRDQMNWEIRRDLKAHFKDRLESARRLLTQDRHAYEAASGKEPSYRKRMDQLGEIHFASLTKKETEAMREVIEQLVRKLKDTISRRYAHHRKGVLDVKKTLRRSAS